MTKGYSKVKFGEKQNRGVTLYTLSRMRVYIKINDSKNENNKQYLSIVSIKYLYEFTIKKYQMNLILR